MKIIYLLPFVGVRTFRLALRAITAPQASTYPNQIPAIVPSTQLDAKHVEAWKLPWIGLENGIGTEKEIEQQLGLRYERLSSFFVSWLNVAART